MRQIQLPPKSRDEIAHEIYDEIRAEQMKVVYDEDGNLRSPETMKIHVQRLGWRKRLLIFAAIFLAGMLFFTMSFVLGWDAGRTWADAMDGISLGIVDWVAGFFPNSPRAQSAAAAVSNLLTLLPLGVIFANAIIALVLTAVISFVYTVVNTTKADDSVASRFLME